MINKNTNYNCEKNIFGHYSLQQIEENGDYLIMIIDVIKAAMSDISKDDIYQFAHIQSILYQLKELYEEYCLNDSTINIIFDKEFLCNHIYKDDEDEFSLLKIESIERCPHNVPTNTNNALKCTKCKRFLPINSQKLNEIAKKAKYLINVIDEIKIKITDEKILHEFNSVQMLLDKIDQIYKIQYLDIKELNKRNIDNKIENIYKKEFTHNRRKNKQRIK